MVLSNSKSLNVSRTRTFICPFYPDTRNPDATQIGETKDYTVYFNLDVPVAWDHSIKLPMTAQFTLTGIAGTSRKEGFIVMINLAAAQKFKLNMRFFLG